jgi:hypothetical protein
MWPSSADSYEAWKNWTGYEPDVAHIIMNWHVDTWEDLGAGAISQSAFESVISFLPKNTTVAILFGPIPYGSGMSNRYCERPQTWSEIAAGRYDQYYRSAAAAIKSRLIAAGRDPANTILRYGHELDGGWYPWSVCGVTAQTFRAAWKRMVGIWRSAMPGIIIDFSPSRLNAGYNWSTPGSSGGSFQYNLVAGKPNGYSLAEWAPDPADYDVISVSLHDSDPRVDSLAGWQRHTGEIPTDKRFGMIDAVNLAQAQGKKVAYLEWGLFMERSDNSGGGCSAGHWDPGHLDAPTPESQLYFVQQVYTWMWRYRHLLAYETYFSQSCANLHMGSSSTHGTRQNTPAAIYYRSAFRSGAAPTWYPGHPPPP